MVRARVVKHPRNWPFCGYQEIMSYRQRYRLIDKDILIKIFNLNSEEELRNVYDRWITAQLNRDQMKREGQWTESLAVGGKDFVANIKNKLGIKVNYRHITKRDRTYLLQDT